MFYHEIQHFAKSADNVKQVCILIHTMQHALNSSLKSVPLVYVVCASKCLESSSYCSCLQRIAVAHDIMKLFRAYTS